MLPQTYVVLMVLIFQKTHCMMIEDVYKGNQTCDGCEFLFDCYTSSFPCHQVHVQYITDQGESKQGIVYSSGIQMDGKFSLVSIVKQN